MLDANLDGDGDDRYLGLVDGNRTTDSVESSRQRETHSHAPAKWMVSAPRFRRRENPSRLYVSTGQQPTSADPLQA